MKTRTDLLNFLAEKYNLQRYLEIGVQNVDQNFNHIKCSIKHGVDPDKVGLPIHDECFIFHVTSDDFFVHHRDMFPGRSYDLIFIDGLHTAEQVKKDFENALKVLSPSGFIVLHDCNPLKEEHTIVPRPTERGHWNGDVYKFACQLATNWLSYKTVDIDNGCGVFTPNTQTYSLREAPSWAQFDMDRKGLLNLISWDEFINSHTHV